MNTEAQARGFTLVEVVVALAVVVVAFLAMYGSLQQMVATTINMQEKTFASWVAFDQITELRVKGEFPTADKREGEIELAGTNWLYSIEFNKTASDDVLQVIVRVAPEYAPNNQVGLATGALLKPAAGSGSPGAPGGSKTNFGDSGSELDAAGGTDPSSQNLQDLDPGEQQFEIIEGVVE